MKKQLLLTLLFLLALSMKWAYAQPTITIDNLYEVGDELMMQNADTTGIVEGPSGADQTWDFSGLTSVGSVNSQTVVLPSSTPYNASFPEAELAVDAGGGNYIFFDLSGSDLSQLGFGSASAVASYTDHQKFLSFPFTYNTTFSDNLAGTIVTTAGADPVRSGTITFLADGYGTLILPTATYEDVLRVKYVQNVADVVSIGPFTVTTTTVTTTYYWMVPGNKNSLMNISNISVTTSGVTVYSNSVFYYPGAVAIQDPVALEPDIQLFPNPATNHINLSVNIDKESTIKLSVLNGLGQVMKEHESADVKAGLYQREINLKVLADGLYFVKIDADNRTIATKPIVKQ